MGFSEHFMMFAVMGPPAMWRGKVHDGKRMLHWVVGSLLSVCRSAMKVVGLLQQPSTAFAGRLRTTRSFCVPLRVSALYAETQSMNVDHAVSAGTGLPRHIRWFLASPFASRMRSRWAKWNHW